MEWIKKALNKVVEMNTKFDEACEKAERKLLEKTVKKDQMMDEFINHKTDLVENVVVAAAKRTVEETKKTVVKTKTAVSTTVVEKKDQLVRMNPFHTDTQCSTKAVTVQPVVVAMPTTKPCECGTHIPVEAIFCPMCKKQHIVPMVKTTPAPPTSCKAVGIGVPTVLDAPTVIPMYRRVLAAFKKPMARVSL